MTDKLIRSFSLELVAVFVLLSLIATVRFYQLDADPPVGVSVSSDVFTDPPQYTLNARNYATSGQFETIKDPRRVVFLKSVVTATATVIFTLFGVGVYQSHLVGFLYSFGSLVLFFLFLWRSTGKLSALLFLVLISFNYNQIFYGRLPFLEHAMTFYSFLSLVLIVWIKRVWVYFPAGISLGIAIFFGKAIGGIFLIPFGLYLLSLVVDRTERAERKTVLKVSLFAVGFLAIVIFWFFFTYLPMQSEVSGYFGEQAFSLYGTPDGLSSFDQFIKHIVDFGDDSELFPRMRVVGFLGGLFICWVSFWALKKKQEGEQTTISRELFFLATMIVAWYIVLMIWNYRPLRYQLPLIYGFYGAAGVILQQFWLAKDEWKGRAVPILFYFILFPITLIVVYKTFNPVADSYSLGYSWTERRFIFALIALVLSAGVIVLIRHAKSYSFLPLRFTARGLVLVVIISTLTIGVLDYTYWSQRPTFTIRDTSRDLGMILNKGAVISGPFAPMLSLENDLDCVIHMFGVSEPDSLLFQKFPITHLLLDQGNETRADRDYHDMMDKSSHMLTYHIGNKKVRLFRIAGNTGNTQADSYEPSLMEIALDMYQKKRIQMGNEAAQRFLSKYPESFTGHLSVATMAETYDQMEVAHRAYKKAIEFSPTNYHLNAMLAEFYKKMYIASEDEKYKEQGLYWFEQALTFAPTAIGLKSSYLELKDNEAWELKEDTLSSSQQ